MLLLLPLLLAIVPASQGPEDPRRTRVVLAVERSAAGVLAVRTEVPVESPFLFRRTAGLATTEGSAVVIDPDGVALTNAHVVSGALRITVSDAQGRSWEADVLGLDENLDLAVIRLRGAEGLPAVPVGTSRDLMPGEPTIAIGNPYGLGLTVSTGVVSSPLRAVELRPGIRLDYVQTDAAINPGNSGGALLNIRGELIGINTAILASGQGIGFAIPIDRAMKIARDLLTWGTVRAPWLGIAVEDISRRVLLGTPLADGAVQVVEVVPGGPGEQAGLRKGDLLFRVDGREVASRADLNAHLAERKPGDPVEVEVLRPDGVHRIRVASTALPDEVVDRVLRDVLGVRFEPRGDGLVAARVAPGGAWARARLRAGDELLAINSHQVDSLEAVRTELARAKAAHRPSALFTIRRGRYIGTITLPI